MIKLDTNTLRHVAALEGRTGAEVKDCIVDYENSIIYVVKKGDIGKAIGAKGSNVRNLENILGKKIHIVEHSNNPLEFTKNMVGKENIHNILLEETGKKIIIEASFASKGAIIGKNGKKVQILEELLKRHYNIEEVVLR